MPISPSSTESLIRSMSPIDKVISTLTNTTADHGNDVVPVWASVEGQKRFANIVSNLSLGVCACENEDEDGGKKEVVFSDRSNDNRGFLFPPSGRYMRKLVLRFVSHLENHGYVIEDEDLAGLVMEQMMTRDAGKKRSDTCSTILGGDDPPNPKESCYVSFRILSKSSSSFKQHEREQQNIPKSSCIVGFRVFPHHNDVGLRRPWEAGCCLAEYLLYHPDLVSRRRVLELGSGIGLTGIVIAGGSYPSSLLPPELVCMTDHSEACLENIKHNIAVNERWLKLREDHSFVAVKHFDWCSFCNDTEHDNQKLDDYDVLLAADVVYDRDDIPSLASMIKYFLQSEELTSDSLASPSSLLLQSKQKKSAIFATTYRNKETFDLFRRELFRCGISCVDVPQIEVENSPNIFPCYHDQPRSDVRISVMTV